MSKSTEPDSQAPSLSGSTENLETLFYTALENEAWNRAYQEFQELSDKVSKYRNAGIRNKFYQQKMMGQIVSHTEELGKWVDIGLGMDLRPEEAYEDPGMGYINSILMAMDDVEDPTGFREKMASIQDATDNYAGD